jgi:hypothetical protein
LQQEEKKIKAGNIHQEWPPFGNNEVIVYYSLWALWANRLALLMATTSVLIFRVTQLIVFLSISRTTQLNRFVATLLGLRHTAPGEKSSAASVKLKTLCEKTAFFCGLPARL